MTHTPPAALPTVLVVDDAPIDRLVVRRLLEGSEEWAVVQAADGVAALEVIARDAPAVVLTDLQMPRMNGLELVEQIRDRFPRVPVVLMTGSGSEEIAMAALQSGAASYVPKRRLATDLLPALRQVHEASRTDEGRLRAMGCLAVRRTRFVLDNDPALVGPLLRTIRDDLLAVGLCDATGATRVNVALEEALLNAIYHGNLGVDSALKEEGNGGAFHRLAAERRTLAPYRDRRVRVDVHVTPARARFAVADEGRGFDASLLPDPTDLAYLERPSGRGILLMRAFMDDVTYHPTGTRVTLLKRRDAARDADPLPAHAEAVSV